MNKPVVLGLGNPLFQDEGLGIHVIHKLIKTPLKERVEIIDGGTGGLTLLETVESARQLLVIDAVDGGRTPGSLFRVEGEKIPQMPMVRVSAHQLGFQEVLALARMRGQLPAKLVLLGVQPAGLDWGTCLTPDVAAVLPILMEMIYQQVDYWEQGDGSAVHL